jgi:hypothetical protein
MEAARMEQAIVDSAGVRDEVVRLMSLSGRLWHDTMHGISGVVGDRAVRDAIDRSSFVLPERTRSRCAKYNALRRVAGYFALLADTFLAIEEGVQDE